MRLRRTAATVLALTALAAPAVATGGPASASSTCSTTWGSLPEADPGMGEGDLVGVRSGRHACYDRLVLDIEGEVGGWQARYTPVFLEGSGDPVPLRGAGDLEIIVGVDVDHERPFARPGQEVRNVSGYRTFRQVSFAGSFEGQSTLGLGVRARLPFRVFVLDGPGVGSRVVVDVAHTW